MRNIVLIFLLIISIPAISEPQKKGYISNSSGVKCWYTQEKREKTPYFHGEFKGTSWLLNFDEKKCMKDDGLGLEINKRMINIMLSKWYSHSDAKFQVDSDQLYDGSTMQKIGQCIQSKTYPDVGILVDYKITKKSIFSVVHGSSIQGCTNKKKK